MKDNKDIKTMLKEAGILFLITLLAGFLLGVVFEVTKEPRRIQQEKTIQEACVTVFPAAKEQGISLEFVKSDYQPTAETVDELAANGVTVGTIYEAKNGNELYGYVVESTSSKGYGGNIVLYVGVDLEGRVNGVSITEIAETAGLGMEAPNVLVPQFAGKKTDAFVVTKTGATKENEVDAISSATITSKAVTNAVNGGLKVALEMLGGGAVNE